MEIKANKIKNWVSPHTHKSYEIAEFDGNLIIIIDTETRKIIESHAGSIDWMDENVGIIHEHEVKTFDIEQYNKHFKEENIMAKVVYVDWRDRKFEPEIVGVFTNDDDGYKAREDKESELKNEGYDTDEEVRVWIEDVEIK